MPRVSHEARNLRRWQARLDVPQLRAEVQRLRKDVARLKCLAIVQGYGDMLDADLSTFGPDPSKRSTHLRLIK